MNETPKVEETPGSAPNQPAGTPPAPEPTPKMVPLGELEKERKARQALEARLKEKEQQGLSELEKAQARIKELEPLATDAQRLTGWAGTRLERALKALPKEARDRLGPALEGLPADKAIEVIEAAGLFNAEAAARSPGVARPAPAAPGKGKPTLQDLTENQGRISELDGETAAALLKEAGIPVGGGRVF